MHQHIRKDNFEGSYYVKLSSPSCPLFGRCGGCQLMHLSYAQQLVWKRDRIVTAFQRAGLTADILACEPSPQQFAYRNKIQLPYQSGRLGLYALHSHELVPIEHCPVHCPLGEKAFHHVRKLLKQPLRYLLIKTAVYSEQVLITLVTHTDIDLTLFAKQLMRAMPEIRGVVQNINNSPGNVILSDQFRTLAGEGTIEETLLGLSFQVSPASFFQINSPQAERLYQTAIDWAALQGHETVLDAFCGVGTLSLLFAKQAKDVIGIECVPQAIANAKENAIRNNISNAQFHCARAEEFSYKDCDLILLNPPRKGCDPRLLNTLLPRPILYISCDPDSLARDLATLKGHRIQRVQPFDMFPQTMHVECLVQLAPTTI